MLRRELDNPLSLGPFVFHTFEWEDEFHPKESDDDDDEDDDDNDDDDDDSNGNQEKLCSNSYFGPKFRSSNLGQHGEFKGSSALRGGDRPREGRVRGTESDGGLPGVRG